jgi:hypothetical protein
MRKPVVMTLAGLAVAGAVAAAAPAAACTVGDLTCGTTEVAFTVASGTLAILTTPATVGTAANPGTAPTTAISGSTASVTVPLGATTVTDLRLASTGWSMTATAPDFVLATDATKTIAKTGAAFYVPAVPTADLAAGAPLLSTFSARATSPQAVDAGGSATILTSNSAGPNAAVFTPVLKVTVPTGSVAGLYTGTVTQSVA